MTTQSTQLTDAAQLLHDAQTSGIPISPLTQTYPNLDVAQAYSVQRLTWLGTLTAVHRIRSQGPPSPWNNVNTPSMRARDGHEERRPRSFMTSTGQSAVTTPVTSG